MNNLTTLDSTQQVTMQSIEIAELTGKRHDHVMRDIDNMLTELELDSPKFGGIYLDTYKREKKCYNLPKKLAMTLASRYSFTLSYKIIDRLEALELGKAKPYYLMSPSEQRDHLLEINNVTQQQLEVKADEAFNKSSVCLTPTDIAKRINDNTGLKTSSVQVNKALIKLGYQKLDYVGQFNSYTLTELGKQHGRELKGVNDTTRIEWLSSGANAAYQAVKQ